MSRFLDGERLNGPHVARISARPRRIALPLHPTGPRDLRSIIEVECQVWGGGANTVLPLNEAGEMPSMYRQILPGSQIDDVHGARYDPEMSLSTALDVSEARDLSRSQLAVGILPFRKQDETAPLEIVELDEDDPWRDIYLACLGSLPTVIDPRLVQAGNWLPEISFADFLNVRRTATSGSLDDLMGRTWPRERVITPRQVSMLQLSYAGTASSALRSNKPVLPRPGFARYDAGPNVLVVCSPGSMDDLALLWNLRAAHGDFYATPIGIPIGDLSAQAVWNVLSTSGLARHGMAAARLYITSCSATTDQITEATEGVPDVSVRSPEELLMFGTVLGWTRDEVLIWNEGRAAYKPLDRASHRDVLEQRNIGDLAIMHFDISVEDSPLPLSDDYRADGSFYRGSRTTWSSLRSVDQISNVEWPSRGLMASSLASIRDVKLKESAPGVAARILIDRLGGLSNVYMLCHAPLLTLLESMAARQGFGWYKDRLRASGIDANPIDAVGTSIEELPEKSFHDFKRVLGNSELATKFWLSWAERSSVIIKGFPIQCPECGAKQWIPIGNFSPPISCRGCTANIDYPFGDRPSIDFKYRLSEQTRRVYEADAMGHILVSRFFESIFGFGTHSDLIGLHPGMSALPVDGGAEIGEADVLLFSRAGEFIPIEVKRTASGLTDTEIAKLDTLANALHAPWTAVAACQYTRDAGERLPALGSRNADKTHRRVVLTYDALLQAHPMWALNDDPFALTTLDTDQIGVLEKEFIDGLARQAKEPHVDWLAYSMLRRREASPIDR